MDTDEGPAAQTERASQHKLSLAAVQSQLDNLGSLKQHIYFLESAAAVGKTSLEELQQECAPLCLHLQEAIGSAAESLLHLLTGQVVVTQISQSERRRLVCTLLAELYALDSVLSTADYLAEAAESDAVTQTAPRLQVFLSTPTPSIAYFQHTLRQQPASRQHLLELIQYCRQALKDCPNGAAKGSLPSSNTFRVALSLLLHLHHKACQRERPAGSLPEEYPLKLIQKCVKLIYEKPVVPGFGDQPISVAAVLRKRHLSDLCDTPGLVQLMQSDTQVAEARYVLQQRLPTAAEQYGRIMDELLRLKGEVDRAATAGQPLRSTAADTAVLITTQATDLLQSWRASILDLDAWRLCLARNEQGYPPQQRCQFSQSDLLDVMQLVAYTKELGQLLLSYLPWLEPLLQQHITLKLHTFLATTAARVSSGAYAVAPQPGAPTTSQLMALAMQTAPSGQQQVLVPATASTSGQVQPAQRAAAALSLGRLWRSKATSAEPEQPAASATPSHVPASRDPKDAGANPYDAMRDFFARGGSGGGAPMHAITEEERSLREDSCSTFPAEDMPRLRGSGSSRDLHRQLKRRTSDTASPSHRALERTSAPAAGVDKQQTAEPIPMACNPLFLHGSAAAAAAAAAPAPRRSLLRNNATIAPTHSPRASDTTPDQQHPALSSSAPGKPSSKFKLNQLFKRNSSKSNASASSPLAAAGQEQLTPYPPAPAPASPGHHSGLHISPDPMSRSRDAQADEPWSAGHSDDLDSPISELHDLNDLDPNLLDDDSDEDHTMFDTEHDADAHERDCMDADDDLDGEDDDDDEAVPRRHPHLRRVLSSGEPERQQQLRRSSSSGPVPGSRNGPVQEDPTAVKWFNGGVSVFLEKHSLSVAVPPRSRPMTPEQIATADDEGAVAVIVITPRSQTATPPAACAPPAPQQASSGAAFYAAVQAAQDASASSRLQELASSLQEMMSVANGAPAASTGAAAVTGNSSSSITKASSTGGIKSASSLQWLVTSLKGKGRKSATAGGAADTSSLARAGSCQYDTSATTLRCLHHTVELMLDQVQAMMRRVKAGQAGKSGPSLSDLTALQAELQAFLVTSTQLQQVAGYGPRVRAAAELSGLVLESESDPAAHAGGDARGTVPWELAQKAVLNNTDSTPVHLAVVALHIFDDFSDWLLPLAHHPSQHLLARCQRQAAWSLKTLLATAARKAWSTFKAVAIHQLLGHQVPPAPDTAPSTWVFDQLFRLDPVRVGGDAPEPVVEGLADHIYQLMEQSASQLVECVHHSDLTCMVAVKQQLCVLQLASSLLSQRLPIRCSWDALWTNEERPGGSHFQAVLSHCCSADTLQIVGTWSWSGAMQRFVPTRHTEAMVDSVLGRHETIARRDSADVALQQLTSHSATCFTQDHWLAIADVIHVENVAYMVQGLKQQAGAALVMAAPLLQQLAVSFTAPPLAPSTPSSPHGAAPTCFPGVGSAAPPLSAHPVPLPQLPGDASPSLLMQTYQAAMRRVDHGLLVESYYKMRAVGDVLCALGLLDASLAHSAAMQACQYAPALAAAGPGVESMAALLLGTAMPPGLRSRDPTFCAMEVCSQLQAKMMHDISTVRQALPGLWPHLQEVLSSILGPSPARPHAALHRASLTAAVSVLQLNLCFLTPEDRVTFAAEIGDGPVYACVGLLSLSGLLHQHALSDMSTRVVHADDLARAREATTAATAGLAPHGSGTPGNLSPQVSGQVCHSRQTLPDFVTQALIGQNKWAAACEFLIGARQACAPFAMYDSAGASGARRSLEMQPSTPLPPDGQQAFTLRPTAAGQLPMLLAALSAPGRPNNIPTSPHAAVAAAAQAGPQPFGAASMVDRVSSGRAMGQVINFKESMVVQGLLTGAASLAIEAWSQQSVPEVGQVDEEEAFSRSFRFQESFSAPVPNAISLDTFRDDAYLGAP